MEHRGKDINSPTKSLKKCTKINDSINENAYRKQLSPNKAEHSALNSIDSTKSIITTVNGSKGRWKKVLAWCKFISLGQCQPGPEPDTLVIGGRYCQH